MGRIRLMICLAPPNPRLNFDLVPGLIDILAKIICLDIRKFSRDKTSPVELDLVRQFAAAHRQALPSSRAEVLSGMGHQNCSKPFSQPAKKR
jgi:hypothetical protein